MARSIFISFHYQRDLWRVNEVRNSYLTKGGYTEAGYWDHSLWEETKKKGDKAIKKLITGGLRGTSVTVILIGSETANRRWVRYEIQQSIYRGNGLLGVYIHRLKDKNGNTDTRGANPLESFIVERGYRKQAASAVYPTYDWVLDNGYKNFGTWVEKVARLAGK